MSANGQPNSMERHLPHFGDLLWLLDECNDYIQLAPMLLAIRYSIWWLETDSLKSLEERLAETFQRIQKATGPKTKLDNPSHKLLLFCGTSKAVIEKEIRLRQAFLRTGM
ncbi:MAG: hypothetical protein V1807_03040 [Patescibacteria group bacterium]